MTIDLKWFLPFVLPPAFLATMRAMAWIAGMPWEEVAAVSVVLSSILGFLIGGLAVMFMTLDGVRLNVTIGRRRT